MPTTSTFRRAFQAEVPRIARRTIVDAGGAWRGAESPGGALGGTLTLVMVVATAVVVIPVERGCAARLVNKARVATDISADRKVLAVWHRRADARALVHVPDFTYARSEPRVRVPRTEMAVTCVQGVLVELAVCARADARAHIDVLGPDADHSGVEEHDEE